MGRRIDISGLRHGRLVATKIHSQDKNKRFLWVCKCDCGGSKILRLSTFKTGKITSCGCERIAHNRHNKRDFAILNLLYKSTVCRRHKNMKFENDIISLTTFEDLVLSSCFYCGREPFVKINDKATKSFLLVSGVDRINNNLGYVEGNVRSCCKDCNTAKASLTEQQFYNLINLIHQRNNRKNGTLTKAQLDIVRNK